jgi:hypothetical protein
MAGPANLRARCRTLSPLVGAAIAAVMLASGPVRGGGGPALGEVRGVDDLKRWFNRERGHARLVLLLSPT